MSLVRTTQSLCPHCLRLLDAQYVTQNMDGKEWVFLQKHCPEHGHFSAPIWVHLPNTPTFTQWYGQKTFPEYVPFPQSNVEKGCPYDCGLCPDHAQHTCCALIEVTNKCNLHCPVCYAGSGTQSSQDPSLQDIENKLEHLLRHAGAVNVQLSGGEPTMRTDLTTIIQLAKEKGFPFVQLNTNGLRLGEKYSYAQTLQKAGLSVVYLQWDDVRDSTYMALRGQPCHQIKEQALQHCLEAGLSVVLVATVVKGLNDTALGDIVGKALASGPLVRGVHLQPVSSFGRYPWATRPHEPAPRITLAEVLYQLEIQTDGMVKAHDFVPPRSEHALCSFNAVYTRQNNTLVASGMDSGCCTCASQRPQAAAKQAQIFVAQHWGPLNISQNTQRSDVNTIPSQDFDSMLSQVHQRFTLSGMAFQDAYTLDLERLRRCHIHIMSEKNTLIPFCAYNLTSNQGFSLYRPS